MASLTIELPDEVRRQLDAIAAARGYTRAEEYLRDALIAAAAEAAGRSLAVFEFHLSNAMGFPPRGPTFDQA